ncbi:MAG: hypothetical protein WC696_12140 [Candidatus Methylopumilus sp.]|jgi:hypothetical protein
MNTFKLVANALIASGGLGLLYGGIVYSMAMSEARPSHITQPIKDMHADRTLEFGQAQSGTCPFVLKAKPQARSIEIHFEPETLNNGAHHAKNI